MAQKKTAKTKNSTKPDAQRSKKSVRKPAVHKVAAQKTAAKRQAARNPAARKAAIQKPATKQTAAKRQATQPPAQQPPALPAEQCWPYANEKDRRYHDKEWGVPSRSDKHMFEHLCLECLQCGLSWDYVLQRRDLFRKCFHNFNIAKVAAMNEAELQHIMEVPNVLRNLPKLRAIVNNAQRALELQKEFGSLCDYFWHWTDGQTILYMGHQRGKIPASNGLSATIAKDLKKRGFKYVGPVNIYAHLQACGIVCDHREGCPRYTYITENYPCVRKRPNADVR